MFSPRYTYPKDENGIFAHQRTEWNPDNLVILENTISKQMVSHHQYQLTETLGKEIPILYIDCQKKWEDDIMLFIFNEYIKQSKVKNKETIVSDAIWGRTMITKSEEIWWKYVQTNKLDIEWMFSYYRKTLQNLLTKKDDLDYKNTILWSEADITFEWLAKLMQAGNLTHINVFIDNIQTLDIYEQQRINFLLYTRWAIYDNKWLRIKINNGHDYWKTRKTSSWHRTEATHDYTEIHIDEEDVQENNP